MTIGNFQKPPHADDIVEGAEISTQWLDWFYKISQTQVEFDIVLAIINPAPVAANTSAEQAITITQIVDDEGDTRTLGSDDTVLSTDDLIMNIIKPTLSAGLIINQGRVTDVNEITIEFGNLTASAIDAAEETYTLIVLKG